MRSIQARISASLLQKAIWGFPNIRGTLLGVPIIRIIVFWGLYWGPLILGNYHIPIMIQDKYIGDRIWMPYLWK